MATEPEDVHASSIPTTQPVLHYATGKRRSYNTAFKLAVVEYAERTTNTVASRLYGVSDATVCNWRKRKRDLVGSPSSRKRLCSRGGQKLELPEIVEDNLVVWIAARRGENCVVSRDDVRRKATELAQDYIGSKHWLDSFLERNDIHLCSRKNGRVSKKPFVVEVEQQQSPEAVKVEEKNDELKEENEEGSLAYIL